MATSRTAVNKTADEAQTEPTGTDVPDVPFKPSDVLRMIQVEVAKARANLEAQLKDMIPPAAPVAEMHLPDVEALLGQTTVALDGLANEMEGLATRQAELADRLDREPDLSPSLAEHLDGRIGALEAARPVIGQLNAGQGVLRKMLTLMRTVEAIGKDRVGRTGQGGKEQYSFRGVDDAMNAVGHAQREVGLLIRPTVLRQDFETIQTPRFFKGVQEGVQLVSITRVHMRYTFVDPDDASEFPVEMVGTARDYGDKDTSKAVSAAMKYALFQGLNIPVEGVHAPDGTGMDPEDDNPRVAYPHASGQAGAERARQDWDDAGNPDPRPAPAVPVTGPETDAQRAAREAFEARRGGRAEPDSRPTTAERTERVQQQVAEVARGGRPDPEETPDQRKARRTREALVAGRNATTLGQLNAIVGQVRQEGLSDVVIEGATLKVHLIGLGQVMSGRMIADRTPPAVQDVPLPDEPTDGAP